MKFVTLKPQPRPFEHHLYCRPYSFRSPDRTRLPGRNGHSCIQARGHDSKPANFTVQPGHLSFLFGGHAGTIARLVDAIVKAGRILDSLLIAIRVHATRFEKPSVVFFLIDVIQPGLSKFSFLFV